MRHLIGLVTCEFLISLVLSGIEMLNFTMDSGWLATVRLDIVMFNVAILLIGSTIILGTMTVEKDIKSLAQEMETRLGPSGSFEDDLERRKRAVLTALCDAVLTTNATFQVTGSDEGADRVFRRPMFNEMFTDYFKDEAEKDKFLAAVKKQFPDDDSIGEGPKRMRVTLRDGSDDPFEADVVVSDASTDKSGKVNKYMVGMHIRGGEFRTRALEDAKLRARGSAADKRHACSTDADDRDRKKREADAKDLQDDRSHYHQIYEELGQGILAAFEGVLRPPGLPPEPSGSRGGSVGGGTGRLGCGEGCSGNGGGVIQGPGPPAFHLRRATCEVFRRRASPLGSRTGDRHVDLRRLSLPEPTVAGLT